MFRSRIVSLNGTGMALLQYGMTQESVQLWNLDNFNLCYAVSTSVTATIFSRCASVNLVKVAWADVNDEDVRNSRGV